MFIVRELKELIEGSKVVKVFSNGKDMMVELFQSGKGKLLLKIIPGEAIFLTKDRDNTEMPNPFAMYLRKKLKQGKIANIRQINFDRVVEIRIDSLKLILELFSKGNIILTDDRDKILNCLENQEWHDRIIKKGETYKLPPSKVDLFTLESEEFKKIAEMSDKENIVKTLAVDFSLGGRYAEEVCFRAEVDKEKKKGVDIYKLYKTVMNLKNERMITTVVIVDEICDVYPFEMKSMEDIRKDRFNTFSQGLDKYYQTRKQEKIVLGKEKLAELANIQKQRIADLEKESVEFKEIGDKVFSNYDWISKLIEEVKETKWVTKNPLIKQKLKQEGKIIIEL